MVLRQACLHNDSQTVILDPPFEAFRALIENDATLKSLSREMFTTIPPSITHDPTGQPQVRSFDDFLELTNDIIKKGPPWFNAPDDPLRQSFVGVPINTLLMWPLSTEAGYRFFRSQRVNYHLRRILSTWGAFLSSRESRVCLNERDGWLSPPALAKLAQAGSIDGPLYSFERLYECDPSLPYEQCSGARGC